MSSTEDIYLSSMTEQDKKKYSGKWIAIVGKNVIANSDDVIETYNMAMQKSPSYTPLLKRIRSVDEDEVLLL